MRPSHSERAGQARTTTHERPEPVPGRVMASSNLILDAGSTMARGRAAAQRPRRARRAVSWRRRNIVLLKGAASVSCARLLGLMVDGWILRLYQALISFEIIVGGERWIRSFVA